MKTWRVCLANTGQVWDGITDRLLPGFIRDLQLTYKNVDLKFVMREVKSGDSILDPTYLWQTESGGTLDARFITPKFGKVTQQ